MVFIIPMMFVYVPLLIPSLFVRPAGYVAFSLKPVFIAVWLIIGIICYLLSFAFLRETHAD
jgi:hypothetical protein